MRSLQLGLSTLALLLLLPAGPAHAQQQAGHGACKADVEKFCKGVKPGQGAIAKCLKQNEASLSAPCKDAMTQAHEKMEAFKNACGGDAQQYCKDVKPGHERVFKCLNDNQAKLSQGCRTAMQSLPGEGGQK